MEFMYLVSTSMPDELPEAIQVPVVVSIIRNGRDSVEHHQFRLFVGFVAESFPCGRPLL